MKCKHCNGRILFSFGLRDFCSSECKIAYNEALRCAKYRTDKEYVQKPLEGNSFNAKKSIENLEEGSEDNQTEFDLAEGSSNPILDIIEEYSDFTLDMGEDY